MKKQSILSKSMAVALMLTAFSSCKKDDEETPAKDSKTSASYSTHLSNIGTNVIIATYSDLSSNATTLHHKAVALKNNATTTTLTAAQDAWRATRVPWEKSEGFLFGPVDSDGIDPAIDSWPVNVVDLDNALTTSNLTEDYVAALGGTLKGFHTIEYLLWGASGTKTAGDLTTKEIEYLVAATKNLESRTSELSDAWLPSEGNFVKNLLKAGKSGSIFITQKSALQELVEGMAGIADEVGSGKINDPFSDNDLALEESQFSHNSKADFANNIRSISNVYNGSYNGATGLGIYDIVKTKNTVLADRLKTEINDAIMAINNIPGTFSEAVTNQSSLVTTAKDKVLIIKTTLEGDVLKVINNL